jgi:hypothetical protein
MAISMNRNTEQLKKWFSRVRRVVKKASVVFDDQQPRWCPANGEGTQLEFQFAETMKSMERPRQRH